MDELIASEEHGGPQPTEVYRLTRKARCRSCHREIERGDAALLISMMWVAGYVCLDCCYSVYTTFPYGRTHV